MEISMQTDQNNPIAQLKSQIDSLRRDLNEIVSGVALTSTINESNELDSKISNLPLRIQKIRDRSYAFNKILENQASGFKNQWAQKRFQVQNQISVESTNLRNLLRPLEMKINSLNPVTSSSLVVNSIKNEVDSFKSRISSVESSIKEIFDSLENEVNTMIRQLTLIETTLEQSESASFGFLPGESVVMAVKAVWSRDNRDDKEDPEGYLYLTDQRLLFEQKQEVATKKVLFVTTARETIQKLQFEVPVASIQTVNATKQGLFKNEDWIELVLASGSFSPQTRLHLDGQSSADWQQLIRLVKSHDIDNDRAFEVDKAAVEKTKTAPTKCPNCGGAITKPVLRGMDTITCEFCGNVIRI
jgi:hypothetical protein